MTCQVLLQRLGIRLGLGVPVMARAMLPRQLMIRKAWGKMGEASSKA